LEDTSESFGLPQTADLMFALISTEELEERDQIMVKQLKNRYNDPAKNRKFVLGINRGKMKLYDVDVEEQNGIVNSNQSKEETAASGYDITFNDKFKKQDLSAWK